MSNAKKSVRSMLTVGLVLLGLFNRPQTALAQTTTTWKFQLERLHVVKAQEDDFWEDGDEPYFVVIRFGARYQTANSTEMSWGGELSEDWAKGIDSGEDRDIPTEMGQVDFSNIDIITRDDYKCRNTMPEGGGTLIVAMEHDLTPWDLVAEIMNNLSNAISIELTNLVANGELDVNNPEPQIQAAVDRIVAKTSPDFWKSAEIVARSAGNPDDYIGYYLFLLGAADPRVKDELSIPQLDRVTLDTFSEFHKTIGSNPLTFVGDDANYEVTVSLVAVDPPPLVQITGLQVSHPSSLPVNQDGTFSASVTTGQGVTFDWDWGDGTTSWCGTNNHRYTNVGNYHVKVTASSYGQASIENDFYVLVSNLPPSKQTKLYLPTVQGGGLVQ